MHTHIVAIGGGSIKKRTTVKIDQKIIALSRKKKPKILFVPTASDDSAHYCDVMKRYYGGRLGCRYDELLLFRDRPSQKEIRKKIRSADIIYVGGGNTLKMMRLWRSLGVDRLLKEVYQKGTVMCGVSAGSICWFASGHSDSLSFYNPKHWKYIAVSGLGLVPFMHCPHFDSKTLGVPRRKNFEKMIRERGGIGIALEDNCALHVKDGKQFFVVQSKNDANAYRVTRQKGKVVTEAIPVSENTLSLQYLRSHRPLGEGPSISAQ